MSSNEGSEFAYMKSQNMPQLLNDMREYNKTLQFERDDFAQKLLDAQGDIKVSMLFVCLLY